MLVEVLCTSMLCFVLLNVAATRPLWATSIAGGHRFRDHGGWLRGRLGLRWNLQPTAAFGIDAPSAGLDFGRSFAYLAHEPTGTALAAGFYGVVHPKSVFRNVDKRML